MTPEQIAQIDQWLDGTLSPSDEVAFAEHLRNDVELQRAFIRAAHLQRTLRQAVRDRITRGELGLQANEPSTARSSRRHPVRSRRQVRTRWLAPLVWSAAATLVVVIGLGRWSPQAVGLRLDVADATVTVDGRPPADSTGRDIVITAGSRVEVVDGTATLRTSDGSAVALSSGTRVVIGDGEQRVLDLEAGTASATVTKQSADRNFIITAPRLNARVVGTVFTLRVLEDRTRLTVSEGLVAAVPGNGSEQQVRAGEQLVHSDDLLGWRFRSGGDDVVRLQVDRELRREGRPTLEVAYAPPTGARGWDFVQRSFQIAGRKSVRIWLYIEAADERAKVNVQVVEADRECWLLYSDSLHDKPLRTWIPIDVPLQEAIKRLWMDADNHYDSTQVKYLRVVPRSSAMRFHVDIASE